MIKQAMILAAGMGSRMLHLTNDIPKPMIIVDGMSLIERHLHYLLKSNIRKIVINTYYKADILEKFIMSLSISKEFEIHFSRELELLGTAGGVKKALNLLGKESFFVINNDSIFIDKISAFAQLESKWNPVNMKMLMLLTEQHNSFGYWKNGDFDMNDLGQLNQINEFRTFINPGMYIADYRLFDTYKQEKLELFPTVGNDLMNNGELYGAAYKGNWYHIGDLKAYEEFKFIV